MEVDTKLKISAAIGIICFIVLEIMTLASGHIQICSWIEDDVSECDINSFLIFIGANITYIMLIILLSIVIYHLLEFNRIIGIIIIILFIKFVLYKIFIGG